MCIAHRTIEMKNVRVEVAYFAFSRLRYGDEH